jgi:hypothetical protein
LKTQCTSEQLGFQGVERRAVVAAFDAGRTSSDGGLLLLREIEARRGMLARFAHCFRDLRDAARVEHSVETLICQRVLALACGYEDLNDHDALRNDALLALASGKDDPTLRLASRSTLNRLECTPEGARREDRYHKIVYDSSAIDALWVDLFLERYEIPPKRIVLEQEQRESGASSVRRFEELLYQTRETWSRSRRVVGKAERLGDKANPRFVVTSLAAKDFGAAELYERIYCARGDMENRIKEQQLDLFADRTSSHTMRANQLRLWLSSMAYVLVAELRRIGLSGTAMANAQAGTIRTRLLKIAAIVKLSVRRIYVSLSAVYPLQSLFAEVLARIRAVPATR